MAQPPLALTTVRPAGGPPQSATETLHRRKLVTRTPSGKAKKKLSPQSLQCDRRDRDRAVTVLRVGGPVRVSGPRRRPGNSGPGRAGFDGARILYDSDAICLT